MARKIPNLFIVGAIKGATTSLYFYLRQHPDIFFPTPKETQFFSTKFKHHPHGGPGDEAFDRKWVRDEESYYRLYEGAGAARFLGDATPDYLYYAQTAGEIRKVSPEARIIISLRHPVDRAFSAWRHLRKAGSETLSFEEGLAQEERRKALHYRAIWLYRDVGLYAEQVKRYLDVFGKERVFITTVDEIGRSERDVLGRILAFLGLDPAFTFNTAFTYNVSGRPGRGFHHRILDSRKLFRLAGRLGADRLWRSFVRAMLAREEEVDAMSSETRRSLAEYYREDLVKLRNMAPDAISPWLET